jgi:hypothetical protein
MVFLAGDPDITPITNLITTWIHTGQALVGSIGALALANVKLVCITLTGDAAIDRAETQC